MSGLDNYRLSIWSVMRLEFRNMVSDSGAMLLLVFAMTIYTLIYSIAYGAEVVEDVAIGVVDDDMTPSSRNLINGLKAGPNTVVDYEPSTMSEAKHLFYDNEIDGIVYIPQGYERDLMAGLQANVALVLDGSHMLLYRQVLQQAASDILTLGADVEVERLMASGVDVAEIASIVEPVALQTHLLYNRNLGYGSFVMPSILMVIIQQTIVIGLGLMAARRREQGLFCPQYSFSDAVVSVVGKMLFYTAIYSVSLSVALCVIWPIFGFPYEGHLVDIVVFFIIFMVAAVGLGITLSHLFRRREAPMMLLLWCSVPILLLAGVSYPKEAFPEWLYLIGRLLPSSSAVEIFISISSCGASLWDQSERVELLLLLAVIYMSAAIFAEYRGLFVNFCTKKRRNI